ncbi:MAG: hypothetical protein H0W81_01065 [Chloroflexi bacterium]|nr:hypothetical protein [Chloroflexota bacterium]
MNHTPLWVVMFGSLCAGALMVFGGAASGTDIGQLAAGYGLLVVASSLFLGFGLAIQAVVLKVIARPRRDAGSVSPALGHRM